MISLLVIGWVSGALGCSGPRTAAEWLANKTSIEAGYVATQRPQVNLGATEVTVDIELTSIIEVNTMQQSLALSGFYRTMWKDPRLAFAGTSDGGCFDAMNIPSSEIENLWKPDLYIDNSVNEEYLAEMFEVYPDGSTFWSQRIIFTTEVGLLSAACSHDSLAFVES